MTDLERIGLEERNVGQAIATLKRGTCLLKYGRRGKPKFCPFRLSNDETTIMWYVKMKEKQLRLSNVSRIMTGQRTAKFQRYPRPEKEYQSFSLIYHNGSLDVICKDKDEAENWFVALRALISRNNCHRWASAVTCDGISSDGSGIPTQSSSQPIASNSSSDIPHEDSVNNGVVQVPVKPQNKTLGKAFSDLLFYTESGKSSPRNGFLAKPEDQYARNSTDSSHLSLSSSVTSSSQEPIQDFETQKDIFIWGQEIGNSHSTLLPKPLKSVTVLSAHKISCGSKHAVIVTKQGQIYSWGEGSYGKLGHGVEANVSTPKLINDLNGLTIESVACGENHTCALTQTGDLYTWGDGIHNFGLLGHATPVSHWMPRRVSGPIDGMHISFISCGPWHSACITSHGLLFTFGDGTFGALGHGNNNTNNNHSTCSPKLVEALKGLRTQRVSCGFWHTAAIVGVGSKRVLFTWGNGDKGQLGHGNKDPLFLPSCVVSLIDKNFCQVACGCSMTVALTTLGQVYMMGTETGTGSGRNLPLCVESLGDDYIKEISCGSHHVAVLNSKFEVYTWGKGANGQLGHGDGKDKNVPTLVEALTETRVKSVACGSDFTVAICIQKRTCTGTADLSVCSGCHEPFSFRRKLHNCYNCGLAFCKACSNRRSLKALLAPNMDRPYRVCDECYCKLHKDMDRETSYRPPKVIRGNIGCKLSKIKSPNSSEYKPHSLLSRLSFSSSEQSACQHSESSPNRSASVSPATGSLVFPEVRSDDYHRTNENLTKEISTLREQVEVLSHKAQFLEAELERTSKQLKEANERARDEGEKNKATKEVIKTLTAQLDELVTRMGQGSSSSCMVSGPYSGSKFKLESGAT